MRQTVDADIAILGGGCAGLTLATLLADLRGPLHVAVLEQRAAYEDDRTWSGWRARPHRFLHCVRASWTQWEVGGADRRVIRAHSRLPYDTIPAERLYGDALATIGDSRLVRLHRDTAVHGMVADADGVTLTTGTGDFRARLVVDTRPPAMQAGPAQTGLAQTGLPQAGLAQVGPAQIGPAEIGPGLLQSFAGLEIETDRPCFKADTVGLMAFQPGAPDAVTFLYTLPYSPTRALLELTEMAPRRGHDLAARLATLLPERLGCGYRIIRSEAGCLPMRPYRASRAGAPRILRLGTVAGAVRASTGYGFATIQAQAELLAGRLASGVDAALGWQAPAPPAWMRGMDGLFLQVLRRRPDLAPNLLTTLFSRCPPAPLVRFLSGSGRPLDGMQVVLSMPKTAFLRELAWQG